MDRITKFPLLDETGQEIVNNLEEINNSIGDYIASNNPYYAYLEDRKIGTLSSIEITKVRDYGLYSRKSLIEIDLPKCTNVGKCAFDSCTTLENVNLPECVEVGDYAFDYCEKLQNLNIPKCINVGEDAFRNCTTLENVNLPECTNVGSYAFNQCKKLQNVNIPKCTIIKNGTFQYCNLKKIDLNLVEKIETYAFWNCKLFECVKILNTETVCALANKNAFSGTLIESGNGYIYVPDELIEQYKTATNWSAFANQIKPLSEYVESEV